MNLLLKPKNIIYNIPLLSSTIYKKGQICNLSINDLVVKKNQLSFNIYLLDLI